jgi:hypothetical protein
VVALPERAGPSASFLLAVAERKSVCAHSDEDGHEANSETGSMSGEAASDEKGTAPTIADDLVVTKYKMAAEIVNREFPLLVCGHVPQ